QQPVHSSGSSFATARPGALFVDWRRKSIEASAPASRSGLQGDRATRLQLMALRPCWNGRPAPDPENGASGAAREEADVNVIVDYESVWGNTAAVARAIAEGFGPEARAHPTDEVSDA